MTSRIPEAVPPIRIAVDVRPLGGPPCGYTIYLTSIVEPLRQAGFDLTLLTNRSISAEYPEFAGLPTEQFGSADDFRWEQRDLPSYLRTAALDLYFTGANRGIPWRKNGKVRSVLGLLDIIPYKFPRHYFLKGKGYRIRSRTLRQETYAQLIAIARADAILTISQASARDITALFRRRDVATCLIRLKDVAKPATVTPKDQFVYLGGVDPRKKIDVLLHAFARFVVDHSEYKLVLIGWNYDWLRPLIATLGLADKVVMTGYVDHDTKFRILSECRAMVYPSLYEGYGMAIAEAMQAGIPVIAGRGGSQEEVGGAAVRHINPTDATDIATAMREMLDDSSRNAWIARGAQQVKFLTSDAIETSIVDYFRTQGEIARASKPLPTS